VTVARVRECIIRSVEWHETGASQATPTVTHHDADAGLFRMLRRTLGLRRWRCQIGVECSPVFSPDRGDGKCNARSPPVGHQREGRERARIDRLGQARLALCSSGSRSCVCAHEAGGALFRTCQGCTITRSHEAAQAPAYQQAHTLQAVAAARPG
jgi:hypothetical protein